MDNCPPNGCAGEGRFCHEMAVVEEFLEQVYFRRAISENFIIKDEKDEASKYGVHHYIDDDNDYFQLTTDKLRFELAYLTQHKTTIFNERIKIW